MFKSGKFVSDYVTQLDGSRVPEKQIQPHGVELTIDKIFNMDNSSAVIGDDEYIKPDREEAPKVDVGELSDEYKDIIDSDQAYQLTEGAYVVLYNEKVKVPYDHTGFVFPRSRLLRIGAHLTTAVWDTGYEGRGEGALLLNQPTFIDANMRIGQFLISRADVMQQYDGSHQGENLDE